MSSKIKQQEYFLWQSIIPQLRKNIDHCIKQIKHKPISINSPEDIHNKINKIKTILQEDTLFDQQEFLDVIAFFIQQKVNITLLQMADLFSLTFGKDNSFWTPKITHWANMQTFTNSLIIWNVNQFLRNFINYSTSPLERDFIYQWRQKVQAYLSSLEFLVRKIQRLKKTDNPYAIDDSYIKYHKEKMLYITFVNKFGMKNNNDDSKMYYHDDATVTFQNKAKAQKKLFNFPHATRTIDDMSNFASKNRFPNTKKFTSSMGGNNTLQRYNFIKARQNDEEQFMDSNMQRQRIQRHRQQMVHNLSMIGKMPTKSMNQLRDQLMGVQYEYRQQLQRENKRFENRLRQHVARLTAKKNNRMNKCKQKQKQKQRQQDKDELSQKEQRKQLNQNNNKQEKYKIQQLQSSSIVVIVANQTKIKPNIQLQQQMQLQIQTQIDDNNNLDKVQKQVYVQKMQIQLIQQLNEPLPLYYQVAQQQSIETDQYRRYPMSHATFIHNPLDYYSFQGQPIANRYIPVNNPFHMYPWVNYYVNDQEEYQDFMAISLGQLSILGHNDSQEDTDVDSLEEDESNFIDTRAIITSNNVDWDKLQAEDKMKFDQIVDQNKLRWVADSKHQNGQQMLARFSSVPIYGTPLPYMITGLEKRTRRKPVESSSKQKQKQTQQNTQQASKQLGQIETIVQLSPQQEDLSMTMTIVNDNNNNRNNKKTQLGNEQTSFQQSRMGQEQHVMVVIDDEDQAIIKVERRQKNEKNNDQHQLQQVPTVTISLNQQQIQI